MCAHVTSGKLLSYGGSSFSRRPCVICLTCFDLNVLAVAWGLVQNTVRLYAPMHPPSTTTSKKRENKALSPLPITSPPLFLSASHAGPPKEDCFLSDSAARAGARPDTLSFLRSPTQRSWKLQRFLPPFRWLPAALSLPYSAAGAVFARRVILSKWHFYRSY